MPLSPEHLAKMAEGRRRSYAERIEREKKTQNLEEVVLPLDAVSSGPIITMKCACGSSLELVRKPSPTASFVGVGVRFRFWCAKCKTHWNVNVTASAGEVPPNRGAI